MINVAWLVPSGIAVDESPMHIPAFQSLAFQIARRTPLTVFSFSEERKLKRDRIGNMTVFYLPVSWSDSTIKRIIILCYYFFKEHHRRPFSILHGFWALPCGFLAVLFGKIVRAPSIVTFPGGETARLADFAYGNMLRWKSRAATLWVTRNATILHLLTRYQDSQLPPPGERHARRHIIPFGVHRRLFPPKRKSPKRPFRLLHVANLTPVKDQETLLRSFARVRARLPAKLRIIGPDFMGGAITDLAGTLKLRKDIEFLGLIPHRHLQGHYAWADLYLHTSRHEGQGMTMVEAMASGLPICGTNVGVLADLPDDCKSAAEPGDAEKLADCTIALLLNKKRYQLQRTNALRWILSNDLHASTKKVLELYKSMGAS